MEADEQARTRLDHGEAGGARESSSPFLVRAGVTALVATATSLVALTAAAWAEGRGALQPVNAASHWLNGEAAAGARAADLRRTGVGLATHASATLFWAVLFELWVGPRRPRPLLALAAEAASMSAVACATDYLATPKRFTPGWEFVLSRPGMAVAYAGMAAGLAAGVLASDAGSRGG